MRGNRLREIREARGLTQGELAKLCGITLKQIWRYENNESEPTSGQIINLSRILRVSADYLLGLVDTIDEHFIGDELSRSQLYLIECLNKNNLHSALEALDVVRDHLRQIEIDLSRKQNLYSE